MALADFYARVKARGLQREAHQWSSLVACAQERVVYGRALQEVERGARILDWGCGNGHFSYFLAEHGRHPEAFALSEIPALLREANVSFRQGDDRTRLPYADASFDAVFALGVIEHVAEHGGSETGSLAELARVLKPGGRLFVFHLPNRWSWIEWAKWATWRLGLTQTREHVRRFTSKEFRSLTKGFPWEILDEGRYHFLPRATLGRLPGLRNSAAFCAVVNALDDGLAFLLRAFAQNYYFVLRRIG